MAVRIRLARIGRTHRPFYRIVAIDSRCHRGGLANEILGTYDVDYMGAKFLVRVTKAGDGTYVSAVDPRGLPPSGEAAGKLIGLLKAAIAP